MLKLDQAKRLKDLERENTRLKRAGAELTLNTLMLKDAAEGTFSAPHGDHVLSEREGIGEEAPIDTRVRGWGHLDRTNGIRLAPVTRKTH